MGEAFFPYRRFSHEVLGEVVVPIVEAVLENTATIKVCAIMDTGAPISIFPKSICELLGLRYEDGKETSLRSATGERVPIRVHQINIRIDEIRFRARVGFSELEEIPHILGRLDVFENVEVRFERDGVRFIARD